MTRLLNPILAAVSMIVAGAANAQPSDSQVITDCIKNKDGLIEATCTKGKTGEQYWHSGDQAWYWDRGVVIKRKANINGAPNAVVVVKGLARYNVLGGKYTFKKFYTTSNEYEGIPTPSSEALTNYVNQNLKKVFNGREHSITEVSTVVIDPEKGWTWHEITRFSVPIIIQYKEVVNNTEIADKKGVFDIMFYRKDANSLPHNFLSVETGATEIGRRKYTEQQIKMMKSLADN
jgi:hypothetical protein